METSAAKSSASLFLFSFFLWVFVRGITVSSKIDKHAELYVQTVKKGSAGFTACNQMQMGPQSLGEGSLYHGEY